MIGRVLRPSPGKVRALVHCHSGNVLRHGFYDDERDYTPAATPKRVVALHTCPLCSAVFTALRDGKCPSCHELISPATVVTSSPPKSRRLQVDGVRLNLDEIRARRAAAGARDLTDRELEKVAMASDYAKRAEYLRLLEVVRVKGFNPRFAWHQFRQTFGHEPRFTPTDLEGVIPARWPFVPYERTAG